MKMPPPQLAFLPQGKALLGLSGGRDSVALLHLLLEAGHRELILCHLNHRLRGAEADEDAALVRELARQHSLCCEVSRCDVRALAKRRHLSLETAAREARHAFFSRMSRKHSTQLVILAHHAEDQVETMLANMLRGCGMDGLAGMQPITTLENGLTLLRPMLDLRRQQIDHYILTHALPFREDSSNQSAEHQRNRLRHEALPLLAQISGRDVVPLLCRLSKQAGRDEAFLESEARRLLPTFLHQNDLQNLQQLSDLPRSLSSRIVSLWLREHHQLTGIGFAEIEAALSLMQPHCPAKINLPGAIHLRRKAKKLWVEHPG
jgi:tRNA(Ile)-lysidine synthase